MLMKYHKVSKEGKYEVIGDEKITYATMLKTRGFIPTAVFFSLSKAVTIIMRYSLYRKQFKDTKGNEMPILDYQLQQEKIFPRLA
jgi:acyl-CoA oxidase